MKRGLGIAVLSGLMLAALIAASWATPTTLIVRVKAHDAKFVGSAVGGLKVAVRDFFTNELLATGVVEGGTGNTKVIMKEPIARGKVLSVGKATAKFQFTFDIQEPRKLQIEVTGPMAAGLNIHKETKTTWLIPGQDILGDGILFELYGLIVHAYLPKPHEFYPLGKKVTIGAHVTPMCGCPVRPDFLWNANVYHVKATVFLKGHKVAEIPLRWSERLSHFEGSFTPKATGGYKVVVTAYDDANNQGVAVTGFVVVLPKAYHAILGK